MYSIIPRPQSISAGSEEVFTLTEFCEIENEALFPLAAKSLRKFLEESFDLSPLGSGEEKIRFCLCDERENEEGYSLIVRENEVIIKGKSEKGIFYGVQTLKQMLMQGNLTLRNTQITDEPRFPYRGFMLDCGRYFFTKEAIFVFLEIMALHKLNSFHWHLTEDQGWRFFSEKYFLLTEIGSYRSNTNFNSTAHSGYYTKEDMKEIVAYAHSLFIKVIPEIDSPGHTVSAIAAYPFLSCFDRKLVTETKWGVKHDVFCVGKESTFEFIFSLFDEVAEIFTDKIVHIGGDEVPTTRWRLCPHCQERMKKENMKSEQELHTYYLNRLARYLRDKGLEVIMWNDTAKEKPTDSNICWQLWNTEIDKRDILKETEKGRPFILSCNEAYYLDFPHAVTNLHKAYSFSPSIEGIRAENAHLIKGVEACLWTEFVPDMERAEYLTLPRLGAISESAWTREENRSYEDFLSRLDGYYAYLRAINLSPAKYKRALPGPITKAASLLYWERRKLCWGGIYNFIDNKKVEHDFRKKDNKND